MMQSINELKQQETSDTPLVLFECLLSSGDVERWSTHQVSLAGDRYAARVIRHDLFEMQLSADDAMDGITQLSLTLANADSVPSELNAAIGFKGSRLTVYFAFADLSTASVSSEAIVLFRGIGGDPDEITESSLSLSFINKLSLQRVPVPDVRIQRNCPWMFPSSLEQRQEALDGGLLADKYSHVYRCGYSADLASGTGNLNADQPFLTCDKTRGQCLERGMFNRDNSGNPTRRFGGFEFVPSVTNVRTAGDKSYHLSPLLTNAAKYNDAVPLVYGTGWLKAPLIFARNDGNLTHMEVVLAAGAVQGVLKVIVNDVEIPLGVAADMTSTGWYSSLSSGSRIGSFDMTFIDADGNPLGDPYGSIAMLSIVVPNRICTGSSMPTVQVLIQGLQLDVFGTNGEFLQNGFTNNPAWVLLDLLRRCGWTTNELDLSSFASAASFCQALITTADPTSNALVVPRYGCNLVLTKRQSAASVIRGIRVASSLMLRYGINGSLQLVPETTIAAQQSTLPDGSNSTTSLNGGWPSYEFSDGSTTFSGIVRKPDGSPSLRITSRTIAEISNCLSVEFQDEANEYQQNSLSVVNQDDLRLIGYEVSSQSTALGLPNYNQASRVVLRQLDKLTKGNLFVEFQASFQAIKIRPGDIITVTYMKDGLVRVPFRVTKLAPSLNFQLVNILAQIHNDDWYSDNLTTLEAAGRQPSSQLQIPRPLIGLTAQSDVKGNGDGFDFEIKEEIQANQDGSATDMVSVSFWEPTRPANQSLNLPLLSLAPGVDTSAGSLSAEQTYYYAVTSVDRTGAEGASSFVVRAQIPGSSNGSSVTISGLMFPRTAATFNVYRGSNPQLLYQIASNCSIATTFTDTGLPARPHGLPDGSFDHANFYYRFEYAGPFRATSGSRIAIACQDMGAPSQVYSNTVVRIIEGTGKGQERQIVANDATTLTTSSAWTTIPDATSLFVISEAAWKFAAVSATSPAKFQIPYRTGTVLQISGRAANVLNQESSPDLCPFTRTALGGQDPDFGVPGIPTFALNAPGAGELVLSTIGFADTKNVNSVTSGTLSLYIVDELSESNGYRLTAAVDSSSSVLALNQVSSDFPGAIMQLGTELISVISVDVAGSTCTVLRGVLNSTITSHAGNESLWLIQRKVVIVPFAPNFFENRASANYLHSFVLPDTRVVATEFFVTNSFGDSQIEQQCYTQLPDNGLRTLSGGQFALQTNGSITTQLNAAPPLVVQADHAVRDVRADLGRAAQGYDIAVQVLVAGQTYCSLQIPSNEIESPILNGINLPVLRKLSSLTMNIFLIPVEGFQEASLPPRDLTVTIRL